MGYQIRRGDIFLGKGVRLMNPRLLIYHHKNQYLIHVVHPLWFFKDLPHGINCICFVYNKKCFILYFCMATENNHFPLIPKSEWRDAHGYPGCKYLLHDYLFHTVYVDRECCLVNNGIGLELSQLQRHYLESRGSN